MFWPWQIRITVNRKPPHYIHAYVYCKCGDKQTPIGTVDYQNGKRVVFTGTYHVDGSEIWRDDDQST